MSAELKRAALQVDRLTIRYPNNSRNRNNLRHRDQCRRQPQKPKHLSRLSMWRRRQINSNKNQDPMVAMLSPQILQHLTQTRYQNAAPKRLILRRENFFTLNVCKFIPTQFISCIPKDRANNLFKHCCQQYAPEGCHSLCQYETDELTARNMVVKSL